MTIACFLVLDVGTSSFKASLYDTSGRLLAQEAEGYTYHSPKPGWAEQNPQDWWDACCAACRKISSRMVFHLLAVCVSGQAPGCVPLNAAGEPVRPAILWLDRRSTPQVEWLKENLGLQTVLDAGMNTLDSYFGGVKWLWYRQSEPENYAATWKIVQANGYIIYKLTGEVVSDPSHAGICSPCFDPVLGKWSQPVCDLMEIDIDRLPAIHPAANTAGWLTQSAAYATGLPAGTPVLCGAADFVCSHLGSGATGYAAASMMLGTAGNLMCLSSNRPDARMLNTVYFNEEIISTGGVLAGAAVRWLGDLLHLEPHQVFGELEGEAAAVEPGAEYLLFFPYLLGERSPIWDAEARGVYFGLSTRHTRGHLYRALLEGVAFGFRHLLDIFTENGAAIGEIRIMDGGANSRLWRQIIADVLQLPIRWMPGKDGTSLGAAALAASAVGVLDKLEDVTRWQEPPVDTMPDPAASAVYTHSYCIYRELYPRLKDLFPALHSL